ncbi:conserved Plasmodium protein, unknown function [Plasmodium ovale]|uniref:Uncharacterized protein n=2 Tax=Plasmodium ovale TaxID=36330 RepID=A0A1A8WV73_PLAOA|nr:conserved Plasmodium protein, unknown function [Plasmodium ovale curtisi]SCP05168.1 conserved Plasmodium protein, unknown function [Plasmodium ovale]
MFKFLHDLDVAKRKLLNQLNSKLVISRQNNDSSFFEGKEKNMKSLFWEDRDLVLDEKEEREEDSGEEGENQENVPTNNKSDNALIEEVEGEKTEEGNHCNQVKAEEDAENYKVDVHSKREINANMSLKNDKREFNMKKDVAVITEFFMEESLLDSLHKEIIYHIGHYDVHMEENNDLMMVCKEIKNNRVKCNTSDNITNPNQRWFNDYDENKEIVMTYLRNALNSAIYCIKDVENIKCVNNVKRKYTLEINEMRKKEKILRDINERQTKQLMYLCGQISYMKNDHEIMEETNLHEQLEIMEKKITSLQEEKERLYNIVHDKITLMKRTFELRCYINNLEDAIHAKSVLCNTLIKEKKNLEQLVKKYYEQVKLSQEDVYMHRNFLQEVYGYALGEAHKCRGFLAINGGYTRFKRRGRLKRGGWCKLVKLWQKWNEKYSAHRHIESSSEPAYVGEELTRSHTPCASRLKHASVKEKWSPSPSPESAFTLLDKKNGEAVSPSVPMEKEARLVGDNSARHDSHDRDYAHSRDELVQKIKRYRFLLEELQSALKRKNNSNDQLREAKKLLSSEVMKNEIMKKKYHHLLETFQDVHRTGDKSCPKEETAPGGDTPLMLQKLRNEISVLVHEVERLREDQLVLQEDVNSKSRIISHLIKKHALNEQHFRLDSSLGALKGSLTYDEMKKIMEETLIENIRLRADLFTLAKSIKGMEQAQEKTRNLSPL